CPETSSYGWINFTGSRHVDPYLIGKNGGATERTDVTQSFWVRDNPPVSVEQLPAEVARPTAIAVEAMSWDDDLAYRVAGGSYGVLRSVVEGVVGIGVLAKSFAGAGMYQMGLSAQLGLVDAHAADGEVVGRTVAGIVDFARNPINTTVNYVNNSLAAADRLEASGDLFGASAERSSMVFNIGTAAVDGYGLARVAAPVAGRVTGRLLSDLGDSMMGAGSLRSQIGAVGDVSTVKPFGVSPTTATTAVSSASSSIPRRLYHYTNEAGMNGILDSQSMNPSLKALNPNDVRYGNGQYFSDIAPGTMNPAQLSRAFINNPFQGARYTHFIEIDTAGLNVIQGRPGVYVVPNEVPLDLAGRIPNNGMVVIK
ncbi:HYD1 signature containing ADP-ribosyltransferase family protein, partial [Xanthomonas arboricola]|uniref:HYD1 signature containing ADP-ribosyltransferase family protein n=1 Tax=Xanthomonas arboricola TaxID=56448 RepID=UPI001C0EF7B0